MILKSLTDIVSIAKQKETRRLVVAAAADEPNHGSDLHRRQQRGGAGTRRDGDPVALSSRLT